MAAAASMKLLAVALLGAGTCVVAPAWSIVTSPCPSGMRYLTQAEAVSESAAICLQIDDWTVLEVGTHQGPGLGGNGYQCAFDPTGCASTCTQSLCTPGSEGDGKKLGEGEDIAIWAVAVFVCLSLYVGGGIGWKYHTEGEIAHPHVLQWKNVGGLVVDGLAFTKAKAQSQEYTPPPPAIDASAAGGGGEKEPLTKSSSDATSSGYGSTNPDIKGGAPPPAAAPTKEKKKKKKKKKAKEIADEDGDAKE